MLGWLRAQALHLPSLVLMKDAGGQPGEEAWGLLSGRVLAMAWGCTVLPAHAVPAELDAF